MFVPYQFSILRILCVVFCGFFLIFSLFTHQTKGTTKVMGEGGINLEKEPPSGMPSNTEELQRSLDYHATNVCILIIPICYSFKFI